MPLKLTWMKGGTPLFFPVTLLFGKRGLKTLIKNSLVTKHLSRKILILMNPQLRFYLLCGPILWLVDQKIR